MIIAGSAGARGAARLSLPAAEVQHNEEHLHMHRALSGHPRGLHSELQASSFASTTLCAVRAHVAPGSVDGIMMGAARGRA